MPTLTTNKKAFHDYHILEKYEAGIVLSGQEVKSVKNRQINLKGSYIVNKGDELWLINCHISPYKMALLKDYKPTRDRKLLLNKKEISSLISKLQSKGLTVLPLSVYTKGSLVKIEIGVAKGKKEYDKREIIKKRDSDRQIQRLMRGKV
jgi:SsrA-binding protein